eukprot:TRINITY_DN22256_c0_g1_i1.p1 TRINITY_DN22256_c0_g1~~TRINITY_DN22256_c0_g1_i1.p1  ORF type:complete len:190 (+),score=11.62 TRINITY_DN22256_c0_g1_i1:26-571(+)
MEASEDELLVKPARMLLGSHACIAFLLTASAISEVVLAITNGSITEDVMIVCPLQVILPFGCLYCAYSAVKTKNSGKMCRMMVADCCGTCLMCISVIASLAVLVETLGDDERESAPYIEGAATGTVVFALCLFACLQANSAYRIMVLCRPTPMTPIVVDQPLASGTDLVVGQPVAATLVNN